MILVGVGPGQVRWVGPGKPLSMPEGRAGKWEGAPEGAREGHCQARQGPQCPYPLTRPSAITPFEVLGLSRSLPGGRRDCEQDLPAGGALAPRRPCGGAGQSAVSVPRGAAGGAAASARTTPLGSSALLFPYAQCYLGLGPSAVPAQRTSTWDTGRGLLASEDAGASGSGAPFGGLHKSVRSRESSRGLGWPFVSHPERDRGGENRRWERGWRQDAPGPTPATFPGQLVGAHLHRCPDLLSLKLFHAFKWHLPPPWPTWRYQVLGFHLPTCLPRNSVSS